MRPLRTWPRTSRDAISVVMNGRRNVVPIVSPAMLCWPQSGTVVMPRNATHAIAALIAKFTTPAPTPCSRSR